MIVIYVLLFPLIFFLIAQGIGYWLSAPKYTGPVSDHFNGKQFINPGNAKAKGLPEVLRWMRTRKQGEWKYVSTVNPSEKPVERIHQGIRITFVNHSTFLIQVDGINILTDPVWSERTSPFSWAGPKRMRQPGISFDDLPAIDVVLLSHNHYDHLDLATMKKISRRHHPKIITSLGVKAYLEKEKIKGYGDLDWWDEVKLTDSLSLQGVPAQHFSGRGMFDRDATLWCGYVIKRAGGNIYFAGDSGYNPTTFKEIGIRCAPIHIALIPIGAFKPEWFMSPIHCSPEEAVKIHLEVKAKQSIATHFGTFPLADDGQHEAAIELKKALAEHSFSENDFLILNEGEGKHFHDI